MTPALAASDGGYLVELVVPQISLKDPEDPEDPEDPAPCLPSRSACTYLQQRQGVSPAGSVAGQGLTEHRWRGAADGCSAAAVVWREARPGRGQSQEGGGGWRRSGGRAASQLLEFLSSHTHRHTLARARACARSLGQDGSRETGWGQKRGRCQAGTAILLGDVGATVERSGSDEAIVSTSCRRHLPSCCCTVEPATVAPTS